MSYSPPSNDEVDLRGGGGYSPPTNDSVDLSPLVFVVSAKISSSVGTPNSSVDSTLSQDSSLLSNTVGTPKVSVDTTLSQDSSLLSNTVSSPKVSTTVTQSVATGNYTSFDWELLDVDINPIYVTIRRSRTGSETAKVLRKENYANTKGRRNR